MLDLCWYRWCGCVLSRTNNILEIVPRLEKTIWFVLLNSFTHHLQLQTRFSLVLVRNWGIYSFMYYWGKTPRLVTIVNRLSIFRVDITYWLQIGSNINVQHEEMILSMLLNRLLETHLNTSQQVPGCSETHFLGWCLSQLRDYFFLSSLFVSINIAKHCHSHRHIIIRHGI